MSDDSDNEQQQDRSSPTKETVVASVKTSSKPEKKKYVFISEVPDPKTGIQNGTVHIVTGNTYNIRGGLKSAGAKWVPEQKGWRLNGTYSQIESLVQDLTNDIVVRGHSMSNDRDTTSDNDRSVPSSSSASNKTQALPSVPTQSPSAKKQKKTNSNDQDPSLEICLLNQTLEQANVSAVNKTTGTATRQKEKRKHD